MELKTQIIAVGNQKGGVGKTTNTVNLAAALAANGKKCLIVDLDSNAGATKSFHIPDNAQGIYHIVLGEEDDPTPFVVLRDEVEGLMIPENIGIIPANRMLDDLEQELLSKQSRFSSMPTVATVANAIAKPINYFVGKYDYIFLDTAPNAHSPTLAAYMLADWFVLSCQPEPLAIESASAALDDLSDAREGGSNIELLGIVLSRVNRVTRMAMRLIAYVENEFENEHEGAFKTRISQSVKVSESQEQGLPIIVSHPNVKVSHEYFSLAEELEERIAFLSKGGEK